MPAWQINEHSSRQATDYRKVCICEFMQAHAKTQLRLIASEIFTTSLQSSPLSTANRCSHPLVDFDLRSSVARSLEKSEFSLLFASVCKFVLNNLRILINGLFKALYSRRIQVFLEKKFLTKSIILISKPDTYQCNVQSNLITLNLHI